METMTLEQWREKAVSLFGKDPLDWKFKCVRCGHVQKGRDFKRLVENPMDFAFFSCIGRWKEDVGCDWTLGGLLQIHEVEVVTEKGEKVPSFEFADS